MSATRAHHDCDPTENETDELARRAARPQRASRADRAQTSSRPFGNALVLLWRDNVVPLRNTGGDGRSSAFLLPAYGSRIVRQRAIYHDARRVWLADSVNP